MLEYAESEVHLEKTLLLIANLTRAALHSVFISIASLLSYLYSSKFFLVIHFWPTQRDSYVTFLPEPPLLINLYTCLIAAVLPAIMNADTANNPTLCV